MTSRNVYLDTSAVRGVKGALSFGRQHTITTSALTLVELLNGVRSDDRSFARRRGAIRRVLDAPEIQVVWELPDQRLLSCFAEFGRRYTFKEMRIDPLRQILDALAIHDAREAFLKAESELPIAYHLEFFEDFDDMFGEQFRAATDGLNRDMRAAFDDARQKPSSVVPEAVRQGSFQAFCTWFRDTQPLVNRSITILALARRAAGAATSAADERLVSELYDSYDRSIERFVDAFSYSSMSMASDMSSPGRNDALDLAHMLYLNDETALATEDGKLRSVAVAVGVRVCGADELRTLAE